MIKDVLDDFGLTISFFGTKFDLRVSNLNQSKLSQDEKCIDQNKKENKEEGHESVELKNQRTKELKD